MRNAGLEEAQAGIKTARRNINNLRYADDTTLMAESEEELKSLYKTQEEFPFSQKGKQIMISTVGRNVYWSVNPYQRYSGSFKGTVFSTETINSMRIDTMLVLRHLLQGEEQGQSHGGQSVLFEPKWKVETKPGNSKSQAALDSQWWGETTWLCIEGHKWLTEVVLYVLLCYNR